MAPPLGQGRPPTERLKKANHWFSLNPAWQVASAITTCFSAEVESPSAPFNACVCWKIMCTQWCGCWDHADKIPFDGSLGIQGKRTEEDMPFSPPSGGKPICWGFTSANSQEVLIKTYFAQVITVWWWHEKWARDTAQKTIIRCNMICCRDNSFGSYWV